MDRMFPETGRDWDALEHEMIEASRDDLPWRTGRTHKTAFHASDDVLEVVEKAYTKYLGDNPLYTGFFKSLWKFEKEILGMTAEMLNGDAATAGITTAGGTESNLIAVKAARDYARTHRPLARAPEILCARTAHPSFNKAADILGLTVVRVPHGADYRADVAAMANAVTDDTVMIVGSAPCWSFGVIDPIPALAELAAGHGLWMHVDACVGGFISPWIRRLGYPIDDFDLGVAGVWSISADAHKYGYAAKNISTLSFRSAALRDLTRFHFEDWPSGAYATNTFLGSRTGGSIAAAWAVMNYLGTAGYEKFAGISMGAVDRLKAGIAAIDGLALRGDPPVTLFAFGSDTYDIFAVAEAMERRGWIVNRCKEPPSIHVIINPVHAPLIDDYLADLAASVDAVRRGHNLAADSRVSYAE